ncbi:MAG: autotransporter-associated beta strand repeat-containing protein, partial [Thermoguttaceae bacterium]|nr:autotransporter-associated beta strand repeat-containing protein [Thermoguttaceae bacterium]
ELTGTVTTNEGETVDNRVTFKPENGYNITLSGVLSGSGGLIKDGAEKLTLSGNNTYSGGTLVKAGTLAVSNVNSLGTGAVTVNGGTLDASPAGKSKTFANAIVVGENGGTIGVATGDYSSFASISGSGDLTTNGFLHFNGTGGYNGHVTVNSGYLRINPGAFGIFDLTLNGTSNFNVYETGTVQIGKLNSTTSSWLFASDKNRTYIFEIGAGTSSTDTASYSGYIRGSGSNIQNLTIKKVGDGTQTFNLGGVVYGTTTNSIKEVIVVKGKMIIDANNTDAFKASNTNGFWGTAPITVNSGGTLEFKRSWTTAPNVQMTINGGTLTLSAGQYLNKVTLNSGTVDGSNDIRAGYNGTGVWTVKGGTSTIKSNVVLVLKGDYKTFTVNFDKDATLDVKKSVYGLDGYTGTAVTFKGTGDGPGNILIRGESGTIHNLGNITFNNMNGSIASAITGTSAVTKSGAGTVTLSGANTYTGATTVSGGTLVLASSGSLASNVTVGSGATFVDGASSITSNVTVNGGTFTIGDTSAASRIAIGDFALTSGTVNFDFNSASTADNYDFLTTGAATLTSGTINVTFNSGDVDTWWSNCSDSGYALI